MKTTTLYLENGIWMQRVTTTINGRVMLEYSEPVPEDEKPNLHEIQAQHDYEQGQRRWEQH